MFIRLHAPPKICRTEFGIIYTKKQDYYYQSSLKRYRLTEDGKYTTELSKNMVPEIGRCESVRFITAA